MICLFNACLKDGKRLKHSHREVFVLETSRNNQAGQLVVLVAMAVKGTLHFL